MLPLHLLRMTSEHVAIDRSGGVFESAHSDRASAHAVVLADTSAISIASRFSMSSYPSVPRDGRPLMPIHARCMRHHRRHGRFAASSRSVACADTFASFSLDGSLLIGSRFVACADILARTASLGLVSRWWCCGEDGGELTAGSITDTAVAARLGLPFASTRSPAFAICVHATSTATVTVSNSERLMSSSTLRQSGVLAMLQHVIPSISPARCDVEDSFRSPLLCIERTRTFATPPLG